MAETSNRFECLNQIESDETSSSNENPNEFHPFTSTTIQTNQFLTSSSYWDFEEKPPTEEIRLSTKCSFEKKKKVVVPKQKEKQVKIEEKKVTLRQSIPQYRSLNSHLNRSSTQYEKRRNSCQTNVHQQSKRGNTKASTHQI